MEVISSPQNPTVKLVRSLALKKHRAETGLFVAEGSLVLEMARRAGWKPHTVFVGPNQNDHELTGWASEHNARLISATESVMAALSPQGNPLDCVGIFQQQMSQPPRQPASEDVWVALEDIRDPGNLGTIVRTTDAAGASGVILVGQSCDPFSRECVRASMGSIFQVPLVRMDVKAFAALCSKWPGDVIATQMQAERDYRSAYRYPALIVMGSEGTGLSPAIAGLCTAEVRIPMAGKAESLNLAIATALMLYEVKRPDLK